MSEQLNKGIRGGRVPFLAGIDNFRRLIDAGYTLKSIYDDHKVQLGMSYSQFTRYVGKYIATAKQLERSQRDDSSDVAITTLTSAPLAEVKPHTRSTQAYFHHDAGSGNNRQDLI